MVAGGESVHGDMGRNSSHTDDICETTVSLGKNCVQSQCQAQCDEKYHYGNEVYCFSIPEFTQCNCRYMCNPPNK